MKLEETILKGCFIIEPETFEDDRGVFFESFNAQKFNSITGLDVTFVQDNQSTSSKGVLRGLHFQKQPYGQAKLVRVVTGSIQDVVVDLRKNSITFGNYYSTVISASNRKMIYVPKAFAHGFLALEDDTIVSYKCDEHYEPSFEDGICYNDPDLGIDWMFGSHKPILSQKDRQLSPFNTYCNGL